MPPVKGRKVGASKKKKQTRLPFEALDSSPALSSLPGPSRARRSAKPATLPSKQKILSSSAGDSESDDPILSSAVPTRDKPATTMPKRNGKIPFKKAPLPTPMKSSQFVGGSSITKPLEDSEDEIALSKNVPHPTQKSAMRSFSAIKSNAQKAIRIGSDSSDGSAPQEPTDTPSKSKRKSKTRDDKLGAEDFSTPVGKNSGKPSRLEVVILSQEPKGKTARASQAKGKEVVTISSHDSEESEEEEQEPTKSRKSKRNPQPSPTRPSRSSAKKKAHVYLELSSDSEDVELPLAHKSRRAKKPPLFSTVPMGKSSSPVQPSDDDLPLPKNSLLNGTKKSLFSSISKGKSSSPQAEEDSDSDDIVMSTQPSRRRRLNLATSVLTDDDDDDLEVMSSPLKRRRPIEESDDSDIVSSPLKRKRPNEIFSEDEGTDDELEITTKNTQSNAREDTPTNRTTRQTHNRRHRTEKEKKLELLKRRRAGENIEELTESEESDSDDESGSELQELSEFEDEEEEEEAVAKPTKPAKKAKAQGSNIEDQDKYDSDFIEDDDDGNLGVPLLDIPLEFTHAAHKPLKEHFKDAVEWMVHKKINPGFARDDPVYVQAFRKLDDEYGGYANSKFVSTQWTAEFTRAIYARPEFLVRDLAPGEEITIAGEVICQVCNHRNYVPKFEIQFSGKAYHRDTLDEVEQGESSDESDEGSRDSQKRSVNADGQVIPSEDRAWLSGRTCKANAEQAHSLIHWKYALNDWVLGNLEQENYLTPAKLAEREKMKPKQRRKCANDIVDEWEANNQIKDLYRDFKINLEAARNADNGFKNGRFRH